MPNVIEITKDFPPTRERTVLVELLRVVSDLQRAGISLVVRGGWVPFLKELARQNHTVSHLLNGFAKFLINTGGQGSALTN